MTATPRPTPATPRTAPTTPTSTAGCGPGLYAEALTSRGAQVSGFDQSHDMITLAQRRVPTGAFRVHDLADPLTWIVDGAFDRALLALTLHYLDDRVAALRELHRVLAPGGLLAVSLHHPVSDWHRHGGSYFDTGVVEETWADGWRVRYRRQPLERTLAEFAAAGFALDRLVEPRPVAELATHHPDDYAGAVARPTFIAFRLRTSSDARGTSRRVVRNPNAETYRHCRY
jgi:SAM-dependent methyltransferase